MVGNYAYVADSDSGLRVINKENPTTIYQQGFLALTNCTHDIAVSGDLLFAANDSGGVRIISIANPLDPVEIYDYDTDGVAFAVEVSGDFVYIADGKNGLRIININDIYNPVEVGFYNTGDEALDVEVVNNHIYVADSKDGLYIIQNDILTNISGGVISAHVHQFGVAQNYPNPFNPSTTIQFMVEYDSNVKLQIFDILGREIAVLTDKYYTAGEYEVVFEASNISSGIYFYQIHIGNFKERHKMIKIE